MDESTYTGVKSVQEVDRFDGRNVMMWSAISYKHRINLVCVQWNSTAQHNKYDILLNVIEWQREIFQQDNAQPHTASTTTDFLARHNIIVLPCPSKSPDLNPIEHLWDELDKRVCQHQPSPQSLDQLGQALQDEWQRIPQIPTQHLIRSASKRCRTALTAHGGHNRRDRDSKSQR